MILIPKSIDQVCDERWKQQRYASIKLGEALNRFDYRSLDVAVAHLKEQVGGT